MRTRAMGWGIGRTGLGLGSVGLGFALGLGGCTAEPSSDESGPDATTLVPGSSEEGVATTAPPTDPSSSGPATDTGAPPASSSEGGDGATGPGVYFDLGVPDTPNDKGCQQAVDIVFTMDVSTTMASFIQILADEILAVDAAIEALDLPLEPHYGLAVFVDDALLVNGGVPYTDVNVLRDDFLMWATFAGSNQQVGGGNSNSTWTENSLDAMFFAADEFQWRPAESTVRMVIHTTDDTFWDGPTTGNGVMIQHGYAETVQALQDQEVRTYAFADDIGGACNCDDVTMGWSADYMGMVSIPVATDGGVYPIDEVLSGVVSLTDAINSAVEESICDDYTPQG